MVTLHIKIKIRTSGFGTTQSRLRMDFATNASFKSYGFFKESRIHALYTWPETLSAFHVRWDVFIPTQMFVCDVVDGTMCTLPSIHIPVAAVCTVGHHENVDEGLQVKLLELVAASPQPFCFHQFSHCFKKEPQIRGQLDLPDLLFWGIGNQFLKGAAIGMSTVGL